MGSERGLFAVLRKNVLLIVLATVLVVGIIFIMPPANTEEVTNEKCAPPVKCPVCPPPQQQVVLPPPVAPIKRTGNGDLINSLNKEILRVLAPHFAPFKKAVVIDVADHPNKGDNALYTGEEAFLRLINIDIIYVCADEKSYTCNLDKIRKIANPKDTVICLHGGGNFGDLWPYFADIRERFVKELTSSNYSFIMFPQTVTYVKGDTIERTKKVFDAANVVMTVRDIPSLEFMQKYYSNHKIVYSPDIAWMNGHKEQIIEPQHDVLFFLRTDGEAEKFGDKVKDLVNKLKPDLNYIIDDWTQSDVDLSSIHGLENLSHARFHAGLYFLERAKVVITNRLHGHILSTLIDKPHVIIDTFYGKVFNTHKAWTLNATGTEVANSLEEAVPKALALLEALNY